MSNQEKDTRTHQLRHHAKALFDIADEWEGQVSEYSVEGGALNGIKMLTQYVNDHIQTLEER